MIDYVCLGAVIDSYVRSPDLIECIIKSSANRVWKFHWSCLIRCYSKLTDSPVRIIVPLHFAVGPIHLQPSVCRENASFLVQFQMNYSYSDVTECDCFVVLGASKFIVIC